MKLNIKNIKFKIVFFSTLCVAVIAIVSNLYLYTYMNNIISQKVEDIDTLYLDGIQKQMDTQFSELMNLAILCSSSYEVSSAMKYHSLHSSQAKKDIFAAQSVLNDCLNSSPIHSYVNKFMVFNDSISIQAGANRYGSNEDLPRLLASDLYLNYQPGDLPFETVMPSITPYKGDCLAALFPVSNYISPYTTGYLYIEVDLSVVTDILAPYSSLNPIIVYSESGTAISADTLEQPDLSGVDFMSLQSKDTFLANGKEYRVDIRPLSKIGLSLYNCTDISAISIDSKKRSYALTVMIVSVLLTSAGITAIISNYITRPIHKLIKRIKKISENDFSVDPKAEVSNDEIGEVFQVVNEMSLSIDNLIKENVAQNEQKKNIEIDLLQSQINPHFLYNTLDSIHWMAVIQKNPGIQDMTRCLSNLLKNMSKGFSQKITLREELDLLNDYVTIQSIRYLDTFELINRIDPSFYSCLIVKLTLQPLVENAIFHGIEPSGVYGTITLDAREEGEYLLISVSDTGVGMTPKELSHVLDTSAGKTRHSMNGIGVGNVHHRLNLVYGSSCGLTIESKKEEGTRIIIRIKKEEEDL